MQKAMARAAAEAQIWKSKFTTEAVARIEDLENARTKLMVSVLRIINFLRKNDCLHHAMGSGFFGWESERRGEREWKWCEKIEERAKALRKDPLSAFGEKLDRFGLAVTTTRRRGHGVTAEGGETQRTP